MMFKDVKLNKAKVTFNYEAHYETIQVVQGVFPKINNNKIQRYS